MPATRNIMASALFSLPFLGYQPVNISNGEPALTAANLTKQTILGPPFAWPWNRASFQLDVDGDSQDYTVTLANYGFIEKVWLTDASGNVMEIMVRLALSAESHIQRPQSCAVQQINDDGSVLIRLNAIPDQPYIIGGFYQLAPILMSSMAASWAPLPDYTSYIYDWGFLSTVAMLTKDARFPIFAQRFVSHLLGAQGGLSALQRNIFLGNWLEVMSSAQETQLVTQQAIAARQV
jgi:hypothetical protein